MKSTILFLMENTDTTSFRWFLADWSWPFMFISWLWLFGKYTSWWVKINQ